MFAAVTLPQFGVDLEGLVSAAIAAMGAVVGVVCGGFFVFLLLRRELRFASRYIDGVQSRAKESRDWARLLDTSTRVAKPVREKRRRLTPEERAARVAERLEQRAQRAAARAAAKQEMREERQAERDALDADRFARAQQRGV